LIRNRPTAAARRRRAHRFLFRRRVLWGRPPQNQQLPYVLHRGRAELRADLSQHRFALAADVAEGAHLDQLVRAQVDVDLANDRRCQTVLADRDDRVQMMGTGTQRAPFGGS